MADKIFKDIVKRFGFDEIDIDSWVFKCYSRVTAGLFFLAGAFSVASEYTGKDAIQCKGGDSYDSNYCWLHGTGHLKPDQISKEIQNGHDCVSTDSIGTNGEPGEDKLVNYYIWVSLVLFLCAGVFLVPNEIWKHFEGGMLKQFKSLYTDGNQYMDIPEENRKGSAEQFRKLSKSATRRYFFTFLLFEFVYFILGIVVFQLLDTFLDGKFVSYGSDTLEYLRGEAKPVEITTNDGTYSGAINPMCNAFPTIVSCAVTTYGVNGEADTKSHICLLGQNIMNQKIFLVLWLWFVVLFSVSACHIIYRLTTFLVPDFQARAIKGHMRTKDDAAVKKLQFGFDHIGNWFLLTQIGSNSNPYAFRIFMEDLTGVRITRGPEKENQKRQKLKHTNTNKTDEQQRIENEGDKVKKGGNTGESIELGDVTKEGKSPV